MKDILKQSMDNVCHRIKMKTLYLSEQSIPKNKKERVLKSLYDDIDLLNEIFVYNLKEKVVEK